MARTTDMTKTSLYDSDFVEWTEQQAELLRRGDFHGLDVHRLADEIESMGLRDRRELRSRLRVLLTHLIKWEFQPRKRSPSWKATIREQRRAILELTGDSPSLLHEVCEKTAGRLLNIPGPAILKVWPEAVEDALDETRSDLSGRIGSFCHYDPNQILDFSFFPGNK